MSEPLKGASIHFQLLIAGTMVFLAGFFWVVNQHGSGPEWYIIFGLSAIAVYLAFVVVVSGHALLERPPEPPKRPEEPTERDFDAT